MSFVDRALARRIEASECRFCCDIAASVCTDVDERAGTWPVAGGAAVFAGDDSPCNKLIGLGIDRPPTSDELASAERAFDERRTPLRAEVCSLAGETAAMLAARGYLLQGFEYVLGRPIGDPVAMSPSVASIERLAAHEHAAWLDTLVEGFAAADPHAPHEEFPRAALERIFDRLARAQGFHRYVARLDDRLVAAASLRIDDGLAHFTGSTTLPSARRRGLQRALVERRLADAADAGCELGFVVTAPGSTSQQNMTRAGFELLYVRAVLERPVAASVE